MEASKGLPACLAVLSLLMVASYSAVQGMDCVSHISWKRVFFPDMDEPGNIGCWRHRYKAEVTISNATYDILAIVCHNDTRYKLFIQDLASSEYRHIVDLSGDGADHCELVGTDDVYRANVVAGPSKINYTRHVYSRADWGEPFVEGKLSLWRSPSWYECGISIPSSRKVYGKEHGCKENAVPANMTRTEIVLRESTRVYLIAIGVFVAIAGLVMAIAYLSVRYGPDDWYKCKSGEPALHIPPEELPPAESLRSALSHPPAPLPHPDPSAPAPTPPTVPEGNHQGAPPQYENAEKFPLVPTTESEAPPPKYSDHQDYPAVMTSL